VQIKPPKLETQFEDLPLTLPVFPLSGVLLLPRAKMPLNIFEPRYLNMIVDAMRSDRLIGMIQPHQESGDDDPSKLYQVGCAGRITSFSETEDQRLLVTLTGVCRFRVTEELQSMRGYRIVRPQWDDFEADFQVDAGEIDRERLLACLKGYLTANQIEADWTAVADSSAERLVTTLAMIFPFEPSEKQALLESNTVVARAETIMTLMELASAEQGDGSHVRH
jgi:Lon protease-like protein